MENTGTLRKMIVEDAETIHYWLNLNKEKSFFLNDLIGSEIELSWTGQINCINCGRSIKKTYGQGFCYPCFMESPQAAPCIVRPELCEAHLGKGRDVEWEESHHNQPHMVYLAQTSGIKVGVTRKTQVPTRWIDQGAWRCILLAETPYRQLAGLIEVELKQYVSDRTDWRKMLTDSKSDENIETQREELLEYLPDSLLEYAIEKADLYEFKYPVPEFPTKVQTVKLEDVKTIRDKLTGIRGQYLYFNNGDVVNLRKYNGYEVRFSA